MGPQPLDCLLAERLLAVGRYNHLVTLTDELGIYIEGSHGIRLENQLFVKKAEKTVLLRDRKSVV